MGQMLTVNRSQEEEEPNGFQVSNRFVFEEEERTSSNEESPKQEDVKKFCSMFMIGKRNIFKLQKSGKVKSVPIEEKSEESFKCDEDTFVRTKKKEGFNSSLRLNVERKKGPINECENVQDIGIKRKLRWDRCKNCFKTHFPYPKLCRWEISRQMIESEHLDKANGCITIPDEMKLKINNQIARIEAEAKPLEDLICEAVSLNGQNSQSFPDLVLENE